MPCLNVFHFLPRKKNLSVEVQFAECILMDHEGINVIGTVNHAMFYISDSKNKTINRVHCINGPNDEYYVENSRAKHNVPTTRTVKGITGEEFATLLAEFPPPPLDKGDCQWWAVSNLLNLEEKCLIKSGTAIDLLSDARMDSTRLMEFEDFRDELQRFKSESGTFPKIGLVTHDLLMSLDSVIEETESSLKPHSINF